MDLAVGLAVGAAFGSVVSSFVKGLITPLVGAIFGTPDFSGISFSINGSKFLVGEFLNAIISFVLIAVTIYFLLLRP